MRYRKLDENGDYMLGRRSQFHKGRAAVGQAVKTRLRHLLGEWWENTEDGLPLYQEILGTFHAVDYRAQRIDLVFSERIFGTIGVERIVTYDSSIDRASRVYSAHCVIETELGETIDMLISGTSDGTISVTL